MCSPRLRQRSADNIDDETRAHAETIATALRKAKKPLVVAGTSLGSEAVLTAAGNVMRALESVLAPHSLRPVAEARNIPKWIWLKEHKYRLWYSEHAEWFHPMFITKKQQVEGVEKECE